MAWFHFCTVNHDDIGRSTLVDMADWFEAGLVDLGHKVTFSDTQVETAAINLFWDNFGHGDWSIPLASAGINYGIVATEIPDGKGFNWRSEPAWHERFKAFHEVAKRASFIWTMVESTKPFYSKFCPTEYVELGFSNRLISRYINDDPEFDFCFFGLRTPYREEVVTQLRRYAKVVWPEKILSAKDVALLIGKCRIGLNFKQSNAWPVPSPTRLGRLMMARRAVAAEYVPIATRQGELAGICPQSSNFSEYAIDMLSSNWKLRAANVFDAYRETMPMKEIMNRVLERTLDSNFTAGSSRSISVSCIPHPKVIAVEGKWNIVLYDKKYIGLMQELGSDVDITIGGDNLESIFGPQKVVYANSLEAVRDKIIALGV